MRRVKCRRVPIGRAQRLVGQDRDGAPPVQPRNDAVEPRDRADRDGAHRHQEVEDDRYWEESSATPKPTPISIDAMT